jgi:hypothetical protein
MKNYLIVLIAFALLVCCKSQRLNQASAEATPLDTIADLQLLSEKGRAVYKSPSGKYYEMYFVADSTEFLDSGITESNGTSIMALRAATNRRCDHDEFDGKYRKEAKTSIHSGSYKKYTTLARFMNTLVDDDFMAGEHDPAITTSSTRVVEESKNVRIVKAYLYAYSKQTDEDYHLIFGTSTNPETARYFNAEISGVPSAGSASHDALQTVWDNFNSDIGGESCRSGYYFFETPQRVELKGSLFFDKEHYNENIGPAEARPLSAWEIHPITYLRFY